MLSHSFHVKESLVNVVKMVSLPSESVPVFGNDPRVLSLCFKMTRHMCLEMTLGFFGAQNDVPGSKNGFKSSVFENDPRNVFENDRPAL